MTFPQWMRLAFPWLNPAGPDYRNMRAAWEAGYQAGLQVSGQTLQVCTCDRRADV